MRLRKIYIFVIILSLLMPETTSENTDPSSEEKKGWSLFKRKNKEYKEKSDRKGFLGIFKRKRKKDAEEDLIVTEEERKRQETRDGQEIVRVPFTPMEETDEVLSSSGSREEEPLENVKEEVQSDDVTVNKETDTLNELNNQIEQNSINSEDSGDSKKNKEIYIYKDKVVDSKTDEGPSWPFTLSSTDEAKSDEASNNKNLDLTSVDSSQISKTATQNTSISNSSLDNSQNQLLQTIIDQNKKIDLLIATLNKDSQEVQFDASSDVELSEQNDLSGSDSQDMLELLKIVQNKFFEIESMVSGSDSLYTTAHQDIKNMMIKMESMNMRLETKIQSLEVSLGLLETDLAVRVDSLEKNMSSRDSRIDELESLNKDLVMQMLKLDNKLAAKVIKLENKMLELDSGYSNLKDLNKDLVFNVLNQTSSSGNNINEDTNDAEVNDKSSLKISKAEYKKRYDEAYARYLDGDYNKALSMFNSLLQLENINDLTDNCQYWVGEIYYATRDFRNAINAFNEVFKYEDNNKNSYSQYKLGLCYLNINEKQNAVNAFQKVVDNYPKQSDLVRKSKNFIQKYK